MNHVSKKNVFNNVSWTREKNELELCTIVVYGLINHVHTTNKCGRRFSPQALSRAAQGLFSWRPRDALEKTSPARCCTASAKSIFCCFFVFRFTCDFGGSNFRMLFPTGSQLLFSPSTEDYFTMLRILGVHLFEIWEHIHLLALNWNRNTIPTFREHLNVNTGDYTTKTYIKWYSTLDDAVPKAT